MRASRTGLLRLNLLGKWCPELALPPIQPEDRRHLVEQLCHGSFTFKDIKDKPVKAEVRAWLSQMQQDLIEKHAPERLRLANGRTPRVVYEANAPPRIAVRIQELYDVTATPHIAMGRVPGAGPHSSPPACGPSKSPKTSPASGASTTRGSTATPTPLPQA